MTFLIMRGSRVGHALSFEVSCCAEKAFDASQLLERKTENEASFSQESSLEISTLESSNLEIGIAPATTLSTTYLRFASFTYAISKT